MASACNTLRNDIQGESKKVYAFRSCGIKSMRPIFETKVLIYQSRADLDEKILFGNITRLMDPEIRTMLERGVCVCVGTTIPNSILVHNLLAIEIKVHF